ncbi:hypothetical protein [Candidatus Uabimicrobium amorphum]|uniref:Uncharacterized protein n=1 Tax=Uabimicrobium amorphum TaxID=2596890 RepID=A0A5S9IN80_UABAM|nr:hypothetical protein [Candidatus Uabimicrobium amorphum]BBM85008.1 hypothetical protein UABAM_03371 [Candidatus Uabimicrobium amorphum]
MCRILLIFILASSCATNPSHGYLAQPSPVRELQNHQQSPLTLLHNTQKQISMLKNKYNAMRDMVTQEKLDKQNLKNEVTFVHNELEFYKKVNANMEDQLQKTENLTKEQEKAILDLFIEKVRLEQQILELKMQLEKDGS